MMTRATHMESLGAEIEGVALWASLSEEAETRLKAQVEARRGARFRPDDWRSGDRPWLIELIAPFATEENKMQKAMLADLKEKVFGERRFSFFSGVEHSIA